MTSFAQVPTRMFEKNKAFEKHPNFQTFRKNAPKKEMPSFDVTPLLEEDKAVGGMGYPFRFGKSFDVNLGLKDGKWIKTDSTEVWSLKITSQGAYSLNFIFSELYLPKGAELYIFNEDGSMTYGPVTEKQNQYGRTYLSDVIQGDAVIFLLSVPITSNEKPKLNIQKVVHGYKNIFNGYGDSGDCFDDYDSDVVCYPAWSDESDGVVQILLADGTELCTGSLLNNTNQDYKPYILTAFHCVDIGDPDVIHNPPYSYDFDENNRNLEQYEIDEAEEWLVRFRFRHTTCGGSNIANVITYDDTHFRAAWDTTDFALVECEDNIVNDIYSVGQKVWLGWDRTENTPSSGICIHHPSGDIMKLSIADNNISANASNFTIQGIPFLANRFWQVQWDDGVVERGSSGSPLFDSNQRVVGQLLGGSASCSNPNGVSYYGRFNRSWTGGGTNATRLSNWLEPTGSATTLNSVRQPTPEYSGIGDFLCFSSYFSVTHLAPGYSVDHWNRSNITFPNGNTGNPILAALSSSGNAWVQAVINTGGGQYTMPQKYLYAGTPNPYDMDITNSNYGQDILVAGESNVLWVDPGYGGDAGVTDYDWDYNSGWGHFETEQGDMVSVVWVPSFSSGYETIYVRGENTCGEGNWHYETFQVVQYYYFSIYPNPASEYVELNIVQGDEAPDKTSVTRIENVNEQDGLGTYTLEIWSEKGGRLKTIKSKEMHQQVSIRDLPKGTYFVHLNVNGKTYKQQLIIKK